MENFIFTSNDININGLENIPLVFIFASPLTRLTKTVLTAEATRSSVRNGRHDFMSSPALATKLKKNVIAILN
jgi:hypothetical protein